MEISHETFNRILDNCWRCNYVDLNKISHEKLNILTNYVINNHDSWNFQQQWYKYFYMCEFLKRRADHISPHFIIPRDISSGELKGTIEQLYNYLYTHDTPKLLKKIHITSYIDGKCQRYSTRWFQLYHIIEQAEHIEFHKLSYQTMMNIWNLLAHKNITCSQINYITHIAKGTHIRIGNTLYYNRYIIWKWILIKQIILPDVGMLINRNLIRLML